MRWSPALLPVLLCWACGDNAPQIHELRLVGHTDLGAHGMNAALAVAGDIVYVGSRNDQKGISIVDVSDPATPTVVGELGLPHEHLPSMSSRELRAVPERNLLIVLNLICGEELHGCADQGGEYENLKIYDITDRLAPQLLSTTTIIGTLRRPRGPHEFFLWNDATRLWLFVAAPAGPPAFEIIDATDPRAPVRVTQWDPTDAGVVRLTEDHILHSVGVSEDGRTAYLSHQKAGLLLADLSALPAITLMTPPAAAVTWPPIEAAGPHSAVPMRGRDNVLVVTEEVYPRPFGTACPWGHLRTVDASDPTAPVIVGEFKLPENDPAYCANPQDDITFTAHNVTTTRNLALVTWYSGGLQVLDLSDPARPTQLTQFRPEPLPAVTVEDPALGGHPVTMWSYPVVQDGLIYVVDIRNGLYILGYRGRFEEELLEDTFFEGNSNL